MPRKLLYVSSRRASVGMDGFIRGFFPIDAWMHPDGIQGRPCWLVLAEFALTAPRHCSDALARGH